MTDSLLLHPTAPFKPNVKHFMMITKTIILEHLQTLCMYDIIEYGTVLTELQHIFYHNKRVCTKAYVGTPNYNTECVMSGVAGGPKFMSRSITATIHDHQSWPETHGRPRQGNNLVPLKINIF
jgi:hypothetical protein